MFIITFGVCDGARLTSANELVLSVKAVAES